MSKKSNIDFATSLQKLEQIVESMEEDSLPLEDLISYYEKGTATVKECESALKSAHQQLETIRKKSHSSKTTPSDTTDNPDDDIRLF